ncbi:hypothetical protein [uncultured Apibacter sp.]|nr:hypothetical protein [uncultured Apibacter sp.]
MSKKNNTPQGTPKNNPNNNPIPKSNSMPRYNTPPPTPPKKK